MFSPQQRTKRSAIMLRTWKTSLILAISTTLGLIGSILWGADRGGTSRSFPPTNNHNQIQHAKPIQIGNNSGAKLGSGLQGQIQHIPHVQPPKSGNNGIPFPGNLGQNSGIKIPMPGNNQGSGNGSGNGSANGGVVVKPFPFPPQGPSPGKVHDNNDHHPQHNHKHIPWPVVLPQQCYHPPVKCVPRVVVVEVPTVIVAEQLTQIPVSSQLDLRGANFGLEVGRVLLQIGDVLLAPEIKFWGNEQVTIVLPPMGLLQATKAVIHVVRVDGQPAFSLPCQLVVPAT
jgi:hypothetical protein